MAGIMHLCELLFPHFILYSNIALYGNVHNEISSYLYE